jgi:2-polyprenyl-3-methyl-5-hydroxy-6-metoxy-1,4-benzoquinol methylase
LEHRSSSVATGKPIEWPVDGVESVDSCPICCCKLRRVMHSGLADNVLFCAPGSWTQNTCVDCGSAFLDPRPTIQTIHRAYENYHTHQESERLNAEDLKGVRWLQRVLANGYKNWRFGTNLQPTSLVGVPVAFMMPVNRAILNRQFRHLPPCPPGGRVLDVGFGGGEFLENAKSAGWEVVGVDIDSTTVKNARKRGLDVHQGSLELFGESCNSFDVITMSHVIEHLHDPIAALRAAYRLLKPMGQLWIETPNINSLGHQYFQRSWRGLEPPRHLVLFNQKSLHDALFEVGFSTVTNLPQPSPCITLYTQSSLISKGIDPYSDTQISTRLKVRILLATLFEFFFVSRREFIAVKAVKGRV